ncbi:endonuclease IV [Ureibacillus sp. NPDC094379]
MRVLRQIELFEQFLTKSDKEIIKFAREYGVELTKEEVRQLRPIAQNASVTWLITGIPNYVYKEVEKIVGTKKFKQLLTFLP